MNGAMFFVNFVNKGALSVTSTRAAPLAGIVHLLTSFSSRVFTNAWKSIVTSAPFSTCGLDESYLYVNWEAEVGNMIILAFIFPIAEKAADKSIGTLSQFVKYIESVLVSPELIASK
jgi:hypothetical protein